MSISVVAAEPIALAGAAGQTDRSRVAEGAKFAGREIAVRPYSPTDWTAVRQLCCETGFLGGPVDPLFRDRELFADLFTKPYLQYEPDWALVAEVNGHVVGYLLGSVRRDFDLLLLRCGFQTVTKMLVRLLLGRYAGHERSRQFIRWLITAGFREQPRHPRRAPALQRGPGLPG